MQRTEATIMSEILDLESELKIIESKIETVDPTNANILDLPMKQEELTGKISILERELRILQQSK